MRPFPRLAAICLLLSAAPRLARAGDAEVVAEALFLPDALPPGERGLVLSTSLQPGDPDAPGRPAPLLAPSRLQLALPLGERLGLTADVGLTDGRTVGLSAPAASLKLLLRDPAGPGALGLAASLDAVGGDAPGDTEVLLGLGVLRPLGRVTLRAAAAFGASLGDAAPHLQAGGSVAVALGPRWRGLLELVGDFSRDGTSVALGTSLKWALGPRTALAVGALLPLDGGAATGALQVSQSL